MPKRAIFLILLLLSPPAAAQVPADFFGMYAFFATNNPPTVSVGSLGKTICTGWAYAEPARGTYNWDNIDYGMKKATALRADIFISFYGIPYWAVSSKSNCVPGCGSAHICDGTLPDSLTDVDDFAIAFAKRYCGTPLKYIELANEPYLNWSASDLATLTTHVYNAVRATCPSMKIISPSMSEGQDGYAAAYYTAGGPTGVDVASIHAYLDSYPLTLPVWPEEIVPGGRLFPTPLVKVITTYLPDKPIWNTEGSWGANTNANVITEDQKAAIISRYFIMHWSSGFSRFYWYGWDEANVGTLNPAQNPPGSSIPATAYQQTYNWLVGRTMSPLCAVAGDGVTWSCGLTGSGGYVGLIVWDTAGDESYKPSASTGYTRYRDIAGKVTPYSSGPVIVGVKPILFER